MEGDFPPPPPADEPGMDADDVKLDIPPPVPPPEDEDAPSAVQHVPSMEIKVDAGASDFISPSSNSRPLKVPESPSQTPSHSRPKSIGASSGSLLSPQANSGTLRRPSADLTGSVRGLPVDIAGSPSGTMRKLSADPVTSPSGTMRKLSTDSSQPQHGRKKSTDTIKGADKLISLDTVSSHVHKAPTKHEVARKHAKARVLRKPGAQHDDADSMYPLWETDPTSIRTLGEGVVLMFKFMQRAILIYALMCLCAGVMIWQNLNNGIDLSQSIFLSLSFGNWALNDKDPDWLYGGLAAGLAIGYIILMCKMRDDWRTLTEKTIRATAASYAVKIRRLPNPVSFRKLADWLTKNYGPLVSVCVVNKEGDIDLGCCDSCIAFVNAKNCSNFMPGRFFIDPLLQEKDGGNPGTIAGSGGVSMQMPQQLLEKQQREQREAQAAASQRPAHTRSSSRGQLDVSAMSAPLDSSSMNLEVSPASHTRTLSADPSAGSRTASLAAPANPGHNRSRSKGNIVYDFGTANSRMNPAAASTESLANPQNASSEPMVYSNSAARVDTVDSQSASNIGLLNSPSQEIAMSPLGASSSGTLRKNSAASASSQAFATIRKPSNAVPMAGNPFAPRAAFNHEHYLMDFHLVVATFLHAADADCCVFAHRPHVINRFCSCCLGGVICDCHPPQFEGRFLAIHRPREPSDINWKNFTAHGRWARQLMSLILTAATCVGYYFVVRFARDYSQSGLSTGVSLAVGVGLSSLSFFSEFIFLNFTLLERHKSKSGMQVSMIWKKLAIEILNNVAIFFLVFGYPQGHERDPEDKSVWYSQAAVLLTSVMIADTFVPALVRLIHPVHRLRKFIVRCCCSSNQQRLNEAYVPQLSIYNNFISFLATLTWVFIYAAVLPVAVPLSLLKLVFLYWIEKYNVLRRYGKPDMIDDRAASFMIAIIPWALVAYGLLTLLVFRFQDQVPLLLNFNGFSQTDTTQAQLIMVPTFALIVVIVLLGDVVARFLAAFGCRVCLGGRRASRYEGTCCWGMRKVLDPADELDFFHVTGIESYTNPNPAPDAYVPESAFDNTAFARIVAGFGGPQFPDSVQARPHGFSTTKRV